MKHVGPLVVFLALFALFAVSPALGSMGASSIIAAQLEAEGDRLSVDRANLDEALARYAAVPNASLEIEPVRSRTAVNRSASMPTIRSQTANVPRLNCPLATLVWHGSSRRPQVNWILTQCDTMHCVAGSRGGCSRKRRWRRRVHARGKSVSTSARGSATHPIRGRGEPVE
jgi:hypothetical protein